MKLSQALRMNRNSRLAIVGAGGKTTTLFQLAREMSPVILSVTTHLSTKQLALADQHFVVKTPGEVREADITEGVCLFTGPVVENERTRGVDEDTVEEIRKIADERNWPLLLEADGSKRLPLKAPADYEPPIPGFVDMVVVVAGLTGLGKPLSSDWVHRPERFSALTGLGSGEPVTSSALAKVLTHPAGGLKNIPAQVRRMVLLNQADTVELQSQAGGMVERLLEGFEGVGISALGSYLQDAKEPMVFSMNEKIAGIVLAGGGSRRLGQPKQLLEWQGKPLVRHMAETTFLAGLSPVIVVTGAAQEEVANAVNGLPVKVVHNPDWEGGQSTSVQRGLAELPSGVGGAVFLLVDQPFVSAPLVRMLVEEHARTLAPIVAPLIDEQRGNPVLFDRVTFPDFAALTGDMGARPLFALHRPVWVPWHDPRALWDVDTMEDYQRLVEGDQP